MPSKMEGKKMLFITGTRRTATGKIMRLGLNIWAQRLVSVKHKTGFTACSKHIREIKCLHVCVFLIFSEIIIN